MRNEEKKYLGIDWGEKRIGLAVGDNVVNTATPLKVVANLEEVIEIIKEEEIDHIILGNPLKMRDDKENTSEIFQDFYSQLQSGVNIPIELLDERLSTKAGNALYDDKKVMAAKDAVSAMIILQNYLDGINV